MSRNIGEQLGVKLKSRKFTMQIDESTVRLS